MALRLLTRQKAGPLQAVTPAPNQSLKFRMLLVIDDPELHELADATLRYLGAVLPARDKAEVEKLDSEFAAHMTVFVATAVRLLG